MLSYEDLLIRQGFIVDDVNGYILTNRYVSNKSRLTSKDMWSEVGPSLAIWYAKITRK
jgi:hypothetical protein